MNNLISISTGLVYRTTENKNDQIKIVSSFNPDGIELVLPFAESVFNFRPTAEIKAIFQKLKFPTLHAPSGRGIKYKNDKSSREILEKIALFCRQLKLQNVTFHLEDIEDYAIFSDLDFPVSIENADHRKPFGQTPDEMEKILHHFPNLWFTFDLAHAMVTNPDALPQFLQLSSRMKEIHISVCSSVLQEHHFIHLLHKDEFTDSILKLPESVPLVIESAAMDETEIDLIKTEIDFLRSLKKGE